MPFLWLVVVVCNVIVVDSNELNLQCKCCHINIRGEKTEWNTFTKLLPEFLDTFCELSFSLSFCYNQQRRGH